jgi:putative FmdB family regulatory protein
LPLYEYRCKSCGHQFEKIQSFSAPDEKECPLCHGELERLISAPAVQFKGSGFYSTDYPSKSSKPGASSASDGGESKAADKAGSADKTGSGDKAGSSGKGSASTPSGSSSTGTSTSSSSTTNKD